MRQSLTFLFFVLISAHAFSQTPEKEIHSRGQFWTGYLNQTRFSEKWGLWLDIHYRQTDNFVDRPFQAMVRPAINYYIKDNLRLQAGYAYVHHYPAEGMETAHPEHRPWQQIWWNQKYNGFWTLQWLRFEQRFNRKMDGDELAGAYRFKYRLRYNFSLFVPLKGNELTPGIPFFALIDELFVNFGKEIVYNYFDQNRLFIGLGYPFTKHLNVQLGYMNLFQQERTGNVFINNNTIRLFVFHTIDLRANH